MKQRAGRWLKRTGAKLILVWWLLVWVMVFPVVVVVWVVVWWWWGVMSRMVGEWRRWKGKGGGRGERC